MESFFPLFLVRAACCPSYELELIDTVTVNGKDSTENECEVYNIQFRNKVINKNKKRKPHRERNLFFSRDSISEMLVYLSIYVPKNERLGGRRE